MEILLIAIILFLLAMIFDFISNLTLIGKVNRLERRISRVEYKSTMLEGSANELRSKRRMDIDEINSGFRKISNQFQAIKNYFGAEFYDPNQEKHPLEFRLIKKAIKK